MADFNYEEEVKKRMRKLERLHQAFEAQDLDSGGLQELKNYWKKMYYETVEKYNKLKNKGANDELKEKLEMLNQSISDVLDNWDEEDDRHKEELLMCIDDEIDLDWNIILGKPGMMID